MNFKTLLLGTVVLISASFAFAANKADSPAADPQVTADATPAVDVSPWKKQVITKGTLNQAHFDNWAQGGNDTISWQAGLYAVFERDGAKGDWKNTLRSQYGRAKSSNTESLKTSDELFLETVYSLKWEKWVNPYAAANGQTQMDKGFVTVNGVKTQASEFMDPGYFTESAGIAYDSKKGFTSRLGFAVKETITNRFNQYADNPKTVEVEKNRTEPGLNSVSEFKTKLSVQAFFATKLDVFTNMKKSQDIYSRWTNILTVKATKYLDMNAEFELLYDGHVSIRRQISQSLGIGLSYSLL
jgi:hypothetical protein